MLDMMFIMKFGLILACLISRQEPARELHLAISRDMQRFLVSIEILDARELRYTLVDPRDFQNDIKMLRKRMEDLQDAPWVGEGVLFPSATFANEFLLLNQQYRHYLDRLALLYPGDPEIREALLENALLYRVWDAVRDSSLDTYFLHIRRKALKVLRELLGPQDFRDGRLPPAFPVWRMAVVR